MRCAVCAIAAGVLVLALAAVAALSGPLFPFRPRPSDVARQVAAADDLDRYLHTREPADVVPELAKGIVWADGAAGRRTPLAIVYLHGFSASRKDLAPVVETLAERLGANVFFARLTAHGRRSADGFAVVAAQDWLDDAREALAIGRRIGGRVIVIGMSTGALLATMAALEDDAATAALVLLSPNFAVADRRAKFASGPLGPLLARLIIGKEYAFTPENPRHAAWWTPRMPVNGLVALMNLVNAAPALPLNRLGVPTLVIYTEKDALVSTAAIRARFAEIPEGNKRLVDLTGATRHELAGEALGPAMVEPLVQAILAGVQGGR